MYERIHIPKQPHFFEAVIKAWLSWHEIMSNLDDIIQTERTPTHLISIALIAKPDYVLEPKLVVVESVFEVVDLH